MTDTFNDPLPVYHEDGTRFGSGPEMVAEIKRLRAARSSDRRGWIGHMRTLGPMLQEAKADGVLDAIIEANFWPLPKCAITEEDVRKSIEIAHRIRPELEAEA